jgi:hypothetical protein
VYLDPSVDERKAGFDSIENIPQADHLFLSLLELAILSGRHLFYARESAAVPCRQSNCLCAIFGFTPCRATIQFECDRFELSRTTTSKKIFERQRTSRTSKT